MGLNPPFGEHASRANKFIEKALKFKPKLLILIVPKETKRYPFFDSPHCPLRIYDVHLDWHVANDDTQLKHYHMHWVERH